jgi:hypothetical protein
VKDRWDAEALRSVRALASDVSALLTSLEVSRRRHPDDQVIRRSHALAERIQQSLERLISQLRT